MRLIIFAIIQFVLGPVALVGYLILSARTLWVTKWKHRSSVTALSPLFSRWLFGTMGFRDDAVCEKLFRNAPFVSPVGLWLFVLPLRLGRTLSGFVPAFARYPIETPRGKWEAMGLRTAFVDRVVKGEVTRVSQVVILGAGFDTRSYGLPDGVGAFEVDTANTQPLKRRALERASVDTAGVTFVTVDFNQENWWDRLIEAGVDESLPTLFVWEGVTYYLQPESVEALLNLVVSRMAKGSSIVFDYFSHKFVSGRGTLSMRIASRGFRFIGEPLLFGIPNDRPAKKQVSLYLEKCGLELEEHTTFTAENSARSCLVGGLAFARIK